MGPNGKTTGERLTMKILLQHARNQLWFRHMNVWTENILEAFDFQHSQRALDFIQKHRLQDVQLVVKFGDPQSDVVVRLPHTETIMTCVEPMTQAA